MFLKTSARKLIDCIRDWLSVGPKLDFSTGSHLSRRTHLAGYGFYYTYETRRTSFLDLSTGITFHL